MEIRLPEQIVIRLKPAGYPSRALAYTGDFLIRWVAIILAAFTIFFLVFFLAQLTGETTVFWNAFDDLFHFLRPDAGRTRLLIGAVIFVIFAVEWIYPVYFEVWHAGVTPGKAIVGLRVVDETGLPISFRASAVRALFRLVDMLPLYGVVGGISMVATKRSQRLGDLAAATLVIYDPDSPQRYFGRNEGDSSIVLPPELYSAVEEYLARRDSLFHGARTALRSRLVSTAKRYAVNGSAEITGLEDEQFLEELFRRSVPSAQPSLL